MLSTSHSRLWRCESSVSFRFPGEVDIFLLSDELSMATKNTKTHKEIAVESEVSGTSFSALGEKSVPHRGSDLSRSFCAFLCFLWRSIALLSPSERRLRSIELLKQQIKIRFQFGFIPARWIGFDVLEQFKGVATLATAV